MSTLELELIASFLLLAFAALIRSKRTDKALFLRLFVALGGASNKESDSLSDARTGSCCCGGGGGDGRLLGAGTCSKDGEGIRGMGLMGGGGDNTFSCCNVADAAVVADATDVADVADVADAVAVAFLLTLLLIIYLILSHSPRRSYMTFNRNPLCPTFMHGPLFPLRRLPLHRCLILLLALPAPAMGAFNNRFIITAITTSTNSTNSSNNNNND